MTSKIISHVFAILGPLKTSSLSMVQEY